MKKLNIKHVILSLQKHLILEILSVQKSTVKGITKPCTQLHPAPSTSTHIHPAPSISIQLILTSTQLHPAPPSSFQSLPSSLQHPQQYLNQNIARNWAISPNLDRKIKNSQFFLKIGALRISRVLIPNPDLEFWNSDSKIHFWTNLDPKCQSCSLSQACSFLFQH